MAGKSKEDTSKAGRAKKPGSEAMSDIQSTGGKVDTQAAAEAPTAPDTGGFEKMSEQVQFMAL